MSQNIVRHSSTLPFPFSKAVEANGFLFLSGQVSMTDAAVPIRGDVESQTRNIMDSIKNTLETYGSSLQSVVKVTVWLSDMAHFQTFNQVYASYFDDGYPVRSVVCSKLAFDLDVEVEVQAVA